MIEQERTFLAKKLPELEGCESKEIIDLFIPKSSPHPNLRIRKNGDKLMITRKCLPENGDKSAMIEETISLSEAEFLTLSKVDGNGFTKIRYLYPFQGRTAEIDVYQDALKGLVVVDFEFETEEEKIAFKMPNFCLCEVTSEEFIAGGMLAGKRYEDIEEKLKEFGYEKINHQF